MPASIIEHIQHHVSVSNTVSEWLHRHVKARQLRKGSVLRLDTDDFAFVASGLLMKVNDVTDQVSHFIPENDFLIYPPAGDEQSFFSLEPSTLQYVHQHELTSLLAKDPAICIAYQQLLRYWAQQRIQATELLRMPAAKRKVAFYHRFKTIAGRIPHKYIASYLDMSPSYFSQL